MNVKTLVIVIYLTYVEKIHINIQMKKSWKLAFGNTSNI